MKLKINAKNTGFKFMFFFDRKLIFYDDFWLIFNNITCFQVQVYRFKHFFRLDEHELMLNMLF